jgi:gas vesicle protein
MEERTIEDYFSEETGTEPEPVSRRQFLAGAVVGGAAGLAVAAGTGAAIWKTVDAETQASLESAEAEIARLQGLVDLYEDLEKVGLDAILRGGMAAAALPLQGLEQGAKALKSGLEAIEDVLQSLEEALPSAQESLLWLEDQVSAIANGIQALEVAVAKALEKAAANPIAEAFKDFSSMLLDNMPFGLGDRIRGVLDGLVQMMTSVDELVAGVNSQLLEPMRTKWFSGEEGEGIGTFFVDPVVERILDPLEAHLEALAGLADTWEAKLGAPTQEALEQRAKIQVEIARYKKDNGFV